MSRSRIETHTTGGAAAASERLSSPKAADSGDSAGKGQMFRLRPVAVLVNVALLSGFLVLAAQPRQAWAQAAEAAQAAGATRSYSIPAGPLDSALARFGAQAEITLAVNAELVRGKSSPGLSGSYTLAQALQALLKGSGLEAVPQKDGSYALRQVQAATALEVLPEVVVRATPEQAGALPPAYAGGKVATGGRVGLLGNRDFMDTPFSTLSYTQEFIQDSQAHDIAGVIGKADASVFTTGSNNMQTLGTSNILSIRGFGVDATVISFDGLFGISRFNRGLLDLAERVEVIKGPTALLSGMPPGGAVGGSINIVPKRAGVQPLYRVTGSFESNSSLGVHVDAGRRWGADEQFGIRLNAIHRDGETEVRGQKKRDEMLALSMDWKSERARLSADLFHSRFNQRGVDYGIALGNLNAVPAPPDSRTLFLGEGTYMRTEETALVLRGELDVSDAVSVYAALSPSRSEYGALSSPSFTMRDLAGNAIANLAHQRGIYRKLTGEVGAEAKVQALGMDHRLTTSINYHEDRRSTGFLRNILGASGVPINIYHPRWPTYLDDGYSHTYLPRSNLLQLTSVAIADTLSLMQGDLQFTVGVRHQNVRSDTYNTATGLVSVGYDESATSPAVAALWKINRNTSVYANYIQGLSQGATAPVTARNAGEVFPPYKSKQYEAGVKFDWGAFSSSLSAFEITRPSSMTDPVTNVYSFGGEQRNRGLEFGFFGEVAPHLRLMGGVAYTQAKLTQTAGGTNEGRDAIASPRWQGKLGVEWDVPFAQGLTLTGNAVTTSRQFVNAGNTLYVGGRTIYDLGIKYRSRVASFPATVRVSLLNATDKHYWASGLLYEGTGAPRTLAVSTSIDF